MADAIGVEALRHLGEQHLLLRRPARPGHAGLGVDHDLVRHDRLGLEQRRQRKLRAARVAAGVGDEPRLLDLVAMHLDQAIDRLALQLRRMMLVAVPARIGRDVVQPEVGREVDHLGLRRLGQKIADHLLRGGMRQRAERQIERGLLPVDAFDRDELRQLERRELREHRAHLLPGPAVGGEQRELDVGMAQQQPHQLRAGVAGGAEHADFRFGGRFGSHGSDPLPSVLSGPPDQGNHRGAIYGENMPRTLLRRHEQNQARAGSRNGGGGAR